MVYREHFVEIYVNGHKLDLESQDSLNLRFNNTIYDPEKITSTQAEYSFEFEVPSTPHNDKVFDYANNFSKLNKFHIRWNAQVYADGSNIFDGTLTLNGYKNKKYQCNLVSIKNYSLEDIFGEDVLTDIKLPNYQHWDIPFDGAGDSGFTINHYNDEMYNNRRNDVCFPLVSYGAFQKSPSGTTSGESGEDVLREYTSKFDIDKYNRWYVESFYPSLGVLETMKRAFEYKGYSVGGDAFEDTLLKNIYMSCNLADGQSPTYNLGNPKFGSVTLSATMTASGSTAYQQELNFPYFKVFGHVSTEGMLENVTEYNLSSINLYDVLSNGTVTIDSPSYMYQPNEKIIVIPADGFYKIEMRVTSNLVSTGNITVGQHLYDYLEREFSVEDIQLPVGLNENTPIEVALVRNYEDNYELIKGKKNKYYYNGNPNDETYSDGNRTYPNINEWPTCFPHEDAYNSELPTKQNDLTLYNTQGSRRADGSVSPHVGPRRAAAVTRGSTVSGHEAYNGGSGDGRTIDGRGFDDNSGRRWSPVKLGYVYNDGEIMAYDQAVSKSFICGLSSFYGGVASVMKNGYSWSKSVAEENQAFYPEIGYSFMRRDTETGGVNYEETQYNYNTYINTPISYVNTTNTSMNGYVSCMVYLNKDDVLEVMAVHRGYETAAGNTVLYNTTTNVELNISAASPRSYYDLNAAHYAYNSPTEFDVNLNLANFLNKEKKISDWIQNVIDAYNLEIIQNGNTIEINTKKKYFQNLFTAVELDNRVNDGEAEAQAINYPKSMAIKYKIDTDEWGFEKSVYPQSKLNDPDWKDFGDSGFTTIELNDDTYVTQTSDKNLQFSYTWYDNFNWFPVDSSFEQESGDTLALRMPVISKFTYMIDGYNYEESMKHDGYGLAQRFWVAPVKTDAYVWTRTYPTERVDIYLPSNMLNGYNLSYKTTEKSLLDRYFNIVAYLSSNYVIVEAYLTADEYKMVKNGAMLHFDSDLYYPVEISGFDPSGHNPTEIKMMKKI